MVVTLTVSSLLWIAKFPPFMITFSPSWNAYTLLALLNASAFPFFSFFAGGRVFAIFSTFRFAPFCHFDTLIEWIIDLIMYKYKVLYLTIGLTNGLNEFYN